MPFKKYPKLKYPENEASDGIFLDGHVYVQEKLDGANFGWTHQRNIEDEYHVDDRDLVFRSRNVPYKNEKDIDSSFEHAVEHVRENLDRDVLIELEAEQGPVTMFGEAMHPHTLEYDWDDAPSVVAFDIFVHDEDRFMHPRQSERWFERMGLDVAPILDEVHVDDWEEYSLSVPESAYGDVKAEGLVLKNPVTNTYAKIVRQDFKEKANETFGGSSGDDPGHVKLSYDYITNARIKKSAHKMVDEGPWDDLSMEMMAPRDGYPGLPEHVIRDMATEEAGNIFMEENYDVDIAEFRSKTSSRCARVLRKMINERHFDTDA